MDLAKSINKLDKIQEAMMNNSRCTNSVPKQFEFQKTVFVLSLFYLLHDSKFNIFRQNDHTRECTKCRTRNGELDLKSQYMHYCKLFFTLWPTQQNTAECPRGSCLLDAPPRVIFAISIKCQLTTSHLYSIIPMAGISIIEITKHFPKFEKGSVLGSLAFLVDNLPLRNLMKHGVSFHQFSAVCYIKAISFLSSTCSGLLSSNSVTHRKSLQHNQVDSYKSEMHGNNGNQTEYCSAPLQGGERERERKRESR
ncbi:hypothetical protein DNTS_032460 [Danionella cerebrum]|uniref:Uncharacterized protein n=1 Tax=Danionella cerebrum TaxID=2873325 RepID=A0A553QEC4_9TELE|nr:hypothetical protein DNTS_032460 [Danionella translucida]